VLASRYVLIVYYHFVSMELDEALKMVRLFRSRFSPKDNVVYDAQFIDGAFGAAAFYYVSKDDFKKVEEMLLIELEYNPNSPELKRKLKLLNESK